METWKLLRLVIAILSVTSIHCGRHLGFPVFGVFSPLVQTPHLNLFGTFSGLNVGLTHLHNPVGGLLGIPNIRGTPTILPNFVGQIYAQNKPLGKHNGGMVIGLNGLLIGVVLQTWDGRQCAYDPNQMYLGNVLPQHYGPPLVYGPMGNIMGHVVYNNNNNNEVITITGGSNSGFPCRGDVCGNPFYPSPRDPNNGQFPVRGDGGRG
ncbi:hypothetical protein LOTGIDRAFT_233389 [Lottia gigantea]|uniref:Uncharacterized protein n=1 Tax=Lottia gigantea TaxID=225164 RepID=V4AE29_LOTGI|nr:hypothetical protein LOTGIDRAFT_233389 [Lottia gigantea]ESO91591.1 hypothetical protein LOTGIDRAFT_233389 [Lottia gigantea]